MPDNAIPSRVANKPEDLIEPAPNNDVDWRVKIPGSHTPNGPLYRHFEEHHEARLYAWGVLDAQKAIL